jgi:DNA polymerase-3 subunit gamma/tau
MIIDESHNCFVGNTKIDGKNIDSIKIGDYVTSYNFKKMKKEMKKVLNIFENDLESDLVEIKAGNDIIVCTENHLIQTNKGWVKAKDITSEMLIMRK